MDRYKSTLLPQTNEPEEIKRAFLDLLAKINELSTSQSGNSLNSPENTQTITQEYTVKDSDSLILVNTDSAINIYFPSGLSVGKKYTIERISSGLTANGLTLILSGETIYSNSSIIIFGNNIAKTVKRCERFTIQKITQKTWELIDGEDAGENANGRYIKLWDKTLYETFYKESFSTISGTNTYDWTLPAIRKNAVLNETWGQLARPSLTYAVYLLPDTNAISTTNQRWVVNSGSAQTVNFNLFSNDFWI